MKGVNVKLNYNQPATECRDKLVNLCNKWEMDDSDKETMILEVDDYFMSTIYSVVKILGETERASNIKPPIVQGLGQRYCQVCGHGGANYNYCQNCGTKLR